MNSDEIAAEVISIVKEIVQEPGVEITRSTSLLNELDIDSLTIVRIDILIQARVGLALSADDLEGIDTIDDLVTALETRGQPVDAEA